MFLVYFPCYTPLGTLKNSLNTKLWCFLSSSNSPYAPIHKKRLTHAVNYHRPSRTIHTHSNTHLRRPVPSFCFFFAYNTHTKQQRRVGIVCITLKPTPRSCTKNSTATIGIINTACPFPPCCLHTSRPLQCNKSYGNSYLNAFTMLKHSYHTEIRDRIKKTAV